MAKPAPTAKPKMAASTRKPMRLLRNHDERVNVRIAELDGLDDVSIVRRPGREIQDGTPAAYD